MQWCRSLDRVLGLEEMIADQRLLLLAIIIVEKNLPHQLVFICALTIVLTIDGKVDDALITLPRQG